MAELIAEEIVEGSLMKGARMARTALARRIETLEKQKSELAERIKEKSIEQEKCRVAMKALGENVDG